MMRFSFLLRLFLVLGFVATLSACKSVDDLQASLGDVGLFDSSSGVSSGGREAESKTGMVAQLPSECPVVRVQGDLSQIHQFETSDPANPKALIASARIDGVSAQCSIAPTSTTLDITLDFSGQLGPVGLKDMNGQANYTYPYFISVITPSGQILSKDVFALAMMYDKGVARMVKQDKLRQTIPLMERQSASGFQVVVGFQLTEEELDYNRSQQKVAP
ncbi:MAG: hypothetical protein WC043_00720 [Pseudobdellovibrionaceae bacterium]